MPSIETPSQHPEFLAIKPTERGWWVALEYEQPGMRVPFDAVNGIPKENALDTPTYAIDTTDSKDESDGLFLVTAGCIVDVEKLAIQLEGLTRSGKTSEDISMLELLSSGSVIPLTKNSPFRLGPQVVGDRLSVNRGTSKLSPSAKPIKRIEADLRPYGVHDASTAGRFAARTGIKAGGISQESGLQGDLGGSPLTLAARRLNYALVPLTVQEKMRRPLDKDETLDHLRGFIASRLAQNPPGSIETITSPLIIPREQATRYDVVA